MKTTERFLEYVYSSFECKQKRIEVVKMNSMYFVMAEHFGINIETTFDYKIVNHGYKFAEKTLLQVLQALTKQEIPYIYMKGIVLANQLYDDPCKRMIGDIDIFVEPEFFSQAIDLLLCMGYQYQDDVALLNEHHVVLYDGMFTIELHRNILNPFTEIKETYLRTHTIEFAVNSHSICTFSRTATLLHLLYHLYMDFHMSAARVYKLFNDGTIYKPGRFLYRAYEIALFIEKYAEEIRWEEVLEDIKTQFIRYLFLIMIWEIEEIFPEAFPIKFRMKLEQIPYQMEYADAVYQYFMSRKRALNNFKAEHILAQYVSERRSPKPSWLDKRFGERFAVYRDERNVNYEGDDRLWCEIATENEQDGISIHFHVHDDDLVFSESDTYNFRTSDAINLFLCSLVEGFIYKSITFFPKVCEDGVKVALWDNVYDKVFEEGGISANFETENIGYHMQIILCKDFLRKLHMQEQFYMGFIVFDNSSDNPPRQRDMLYLSPTAQQCYDPIHFIKWENIYT